MSAIAQMKGARGWTLRPPRREVRVSLLWAAFLLVLFPAVYLSCNWITMQREPMPHWFAWELQIPFVPGMVWVYLSLCLSFFLPMFALEEPALNTLCLRLTVAVCASGLVFLLLPTQLGFERPTEVPGHEQVFRLIYAFDRPGNCFPSLHVSWSALLLGALREASPAWLRRVIEAWFFALCASVLLVHQHHVLDVLGGLLVAYAVVMLIRQGGGSATTKRGST